MREICPKCHKSGRNLWEGHCLCTGDVLLLTEFHSWSVNNRVPFNVPQEKREVTKILPTKRTLVFGESKKKKP
jgi:hypothetical protein